MIHMSESISLSFRDLLYRVASGDRNAVLARKGSCIKGRFLWTLAQGWVKNCMSKTLREISRTDVVSFPPTFNQSLYTSQGSVGEPELVGDN